MLKTRNKTIIKHVISLSHNHSILDIGCADMPEVSIFKPALLHKLIVNAKPDGVEVLGFDSNEERVKQLISQGYNCICGNILKPKLQRQFDLIVAGEIIEHVEDQGLFIKNLSHLLRPGGVALISTPNPSGIMSAIGYWLIAQERGGEGHFLWQSPKTMRNLVKNYGLTLEKVYHCHWDYPEPWMYLAFPLELFPRMRPTLLFCLKKPLNE